MNPRHAFLFVAFAVACSARDPSAPTPATSQADSATNYVGCYTDSTDRALPHELVSSNATIASCIALAKAQHYAYAGLQYGGQCFGGNTLGHALVTNTRCDMPCNADPEEICGGSWLNSIYATGAGRVDGGADAAADGAHSPPDASRSDGKGSADVLVEPPSSTDIVVAFADTEQTMVGFGASEMFIPTITEAQADLFFSPTKGIGLSMLRLGISPEGTLYSGSWGTAQEALARNPSLLVWGSPLSPPAADKTTDKTTTGTILASAYESWADVLASFATSAKSNGVIVSAISAQNEPDYNTNGAYDMCLYSAAQMTSFLEVLGPKLSALSPPVKVIAPESNVWSDLWGGANHYGTAILDDPTALSDVAIFATHDYAYSPVAAPAGVTKPIWETEVSSFTPFDPSIENAVTVAKWIHDGIVEGNVVAWHYWWLVNQNADNEGLIGQKGDGSLTKRVYAMGNFSRFIRPGWVRLKTNGSVSGLLLSAYKDTSTGAFAIVAVNTSDHTVTASFGIAGPAFSSVSPYVTSGTALGALGTDGNLSHGSVSAKIPTTLPASMNAFSASIPPGITTFVGSAP
jgi:glucuronoarabinoxylan endo-1,4-beta-xylanase